MMGGGRQVITWLRSIERWLDDRQLRRDAVVMMTSAGLVGLAVAKIGEGALDAVALAAGQAGARTGPGSVDAASRHGHAVLVVIAAAAVLALLGVAALGILATGRRACALVDRQVGAVRRAVIGFWRGTGDQAPPAPDSCAPVPGPPSDRIADLGDELGHLTRAMAAMTDLLRARVSHLERIQASPARTTMTSKVARHDQRTAWWLPAASAATPSRTPQAGSAEP
jgi:hypothetical protein